MVKEGGVSNKEEYLPRKGCATVTSPSPLPTTAASDPSIPHASGRPFACGGSGAAIIRSKLNAMKISAQRIINEIEDLEARIL